MKEINLYLAGPLFSEYEIKARRNQAKLIRDLHASKYLSKFKLDIFNPIELNDTVKDSEPKPNIFYYQNDLNFINKTNFMIVDIDNYDSGTLLEFGYISALKNFNKDIKIIVYSSDFRNKLNWSQRMNRFLDGMIQSNATLVHSEKDLIAEVEKYFDSL